MEQLLDAADELALVNRPDRPDLMVPEEFQHLQDPFHFLTLGDSAKGGKGWFAKQILPAGTLVLISKPIAMIMEWEEEALEEEQQADIQNVQAPNQVGEKFDQVMEHEEDNIDMQDDSGRTAEQEEELLEDENDDGEQDAEDDEPEPRLNELLLLDILEALTEEPRLWFDRLTTLFPRNEADMSRLPAWVCPTDSMFLQVEEFLEQLRQNTVAYTPDTVQEISKRLPHIIRYNVLSVETCSELLSYPGPGGHASLAGVALYHQPSFFNHSSRPNCSRWAIGDIMFFVTNQNILAGEEVCISYIEHDVLCESAYRRNLMLRMDFEDRNDDDLKRSAGAVPSADDGPEMPVVDTDVQNELMTMEPLERLSAIEELLQQALGEKLPEGELEASDGNNMEEEPTAWFQCDVHNLKILQAITLEGLGQTQKALKLWEEAVQFCEQMLPPADESLVVVRVQAALCALHAGELERAQKHANSALRVHDLLFGGGVRLFRRRFRRDLELQLRPTALGSSSPIDMLWPLENFQEDKQR